MLYTANLDKTGYISAIKFDFNLAHQQKEKKINLIFYYLVLITLLFAANAN